jgi:hypothetical protein
MLNAIPYGPLPTGMVLITESAQALSKPKKVLDNNNASDIARAEISV